MPSRGFGERSGGEPPGADVRQMGADRRRTAVPSVVAGVDQTLTTTKEQQRSDLGRRRADRSDADSYLSPHAHAVVYDTLAGASATATTTDLRGPANAYREPVTGRTQPAKEARPHKGHRRRRWLSGGCSVGRVRRVSRVGTEPRQGELGINPTGVGHVERFADLNPDHPHHDAKHSDRYAVAAQDRDGRCSASEV